MKKKSFLLFAVLAVLFVSCSSNTENNTCEIKSDFSRMQLAGVLHNKTMNSVFNKIKSENNLIPTGDYEVMLDSIARLTKYSFDYECDSTQKSSMHNQYKNFLNSSAFYNKIVAHKNISRGENDVDYIIENMRNASNSEYINLDSLVSVDEMLYALETKKIFPSKAVAIIRDIHDVICRSSEGTISDAEFKRRIDGAWEEFDAANFDENSREGLCVSAILYVTQASFEWWKEHQYEMPLEGKVAPWVALDSAGAVAGGVFHCVRNWNNRLQWKDLAIDCAEGAVCASIGKFF